MSERQDLPQIDRDARIRAAAERALHEAAERRALAAKSELEAPLEVGGRKGPDPTRFGDWEKGGLAIDF